MAWSSSMAGSENSRRISSPCIRKEKMKIKFMCGSLERNAHIYPGFGTIRGPKFKHVRLTVHAPSTGHRFIFYFPSGAWWHLDVYFDRRDRWWDRPKEP